MPRFEKWLVRIAAETPVDRVARKALTARLRAVVHFLEAALGGDDEAEGIHQLRVWTRRASAALRLFAPAIPKGAAKQLKRKLRKLRRSAGAVRDCDVLLTQLRESAGGPPRRLVSKLKSERRRARQKLKALRRKLLRHARLERVSADVVQQIAWPKRHSSRAAPSFGPWCRQQLAADGESFLAVAQLDPADDQQLHQLRIAGKRLRYALELAASAIPPRLHRWLYQELSTLQDTLGAVCDRLIAVRRIQEWQAAAKKPKHQQQLAQQLAREEQRLSIARRKFLRWWSAARRGRWQQKWQAVANQPAA